MMKNLLTADQHNRIMKWIESGMKPQSNIEFTEGIERTIAWFCEQAVKEKWCDGYDEGLNFMKLMR